jgi:hypothetical protein
MGTPTNRLRDIDEALREISAAAGAHITIETTRKHRRAVYTFNGRSRFDILSGSPSAGSIYPALRQARRTLRSMGALI